MNLNLNPNSGQIGVWVGDELEHELKVELGTFETPYCTWKLGILGISAHSTFKYGCGIVKSAKIWWNYMNGR